jgi:hypothetical protein
MAQTEGIVKRWVGGARGMGKLGFMSFWVFGCLSVVVVEGACVRDCRGLGLCTFGTVG